MATSVLCSQSCTEQKVPWNLVVEITWKCVNIDVCCCFWMGRNKLSWWRKTGNVASRGENKDYWDLSVCFACFSPFFAWFLGKDHRQIRGFNISRISCFGPRTFIVISRIKLSTDQNLWATFISSWYHVIDIIPKRRSDIENLGQNLLSTNGYTRHLQWQALPLTFSNQLS